MKENGIFIVFEGIDGAGKTCQLQRTGDFLAHRGYTVVTTREPGGTDIGENLREVLLNPANNKMSHRCELLLYAASRAQHCTEVIAPALGRGEAVLCDRFSLSTMAYQGFGRGLDADLIRAANQLGAAGIAPSLTFVIDVPPEVGFSRIAAHRGIKDRLEQEKIAFFQRVRQGYLEEAAGDQNIIVIDGTASEEAVFARIAEELERRI